MKETLFNPIKSEDRETYKTLVHSFVFVSGSEIARPRDEPRENVENIFYNPTHYFYSVYDNPALSGSSRKLFDVSAFVSPNDSDYVSSGDAENIKKNTYEIMRQKLLDYDFFNNEKKEFVYSDKTKLTAGFVVAFSRSLFRDGIKKGSFNISLGNVFQLYDSPAKFPNDVTSSAQLGDYSILRQSFNDVKKGFIFYDAGIIVLEQSFVNWETYTPQAGINQNASYVGSSKAFYNAPQDFVLKAFINSLDWFSFEAKTKLQTGIYHCKIEPNDFRYSSNPTYYKSGSGTRIKVKKNTLDEPVSYLTSVGLYDKNNVLLGVAKVSKPIKRTKTFQNIRVRVDY